MAKSTSQKKEQPLIRHTFSTQQTLTNNGSHREDIERHAYELYLARGGVDGYAIEDWQQAEREFQARRP